MSRTFHTALRAAQLVLILAFAACGGETSDAAPPTEASPTASPQREGARPDEPGEAAAPVEAAGGGDVTADLATDAGADAEETLGRVVTRGGVVEVGLAFEGRVRHLLVSVGQPVEEGSLLAEVEVPELAVAAAEVAGLGHERDVLATRRERVVQLVTEGLAPREQLEGVDATLAELATRRDVALAKLHAAHVDRADQAHLARHGVLRVRAPRAGVLVELLLVEGGVVGPGTPLARLVGPSEAVVQVTTARRPPSGPVTVVTDDGTLRSSALHEPVLDPETGLFHTFYPLAEALPHGTRVTVRFQPRRP